MIHGVVKIHSVVRHTGAIQDVPQCTGAVQSAMVTMVQYPQPLFALPREFKRSLRGQLVSYRGQCRCIVRNFADHGSNIMSVFSLNMWLLHLAS